MSKLDLTKNTGDKLTATEFNSVVDAINDNYDTLTTHANDITSLKSRIHASYYYTQAEYDALVEAGNIDENADYNIYEE